MYGAYKFHLYPRSNRPPQPPKLISQSASGDDCVMAACNAAQEFYSQQNSVNWSIITLKASWLVYNFMSGEVYVFYACWEYPDSGASQDIGGKSQ